MNFFGVGISDGGFDAGLVISRAWLRDRGLPNPGSPILDSDGDEAVRIALGFEKALVESGDVSAPPDSKG